MVVFLVEGLNHFTHAPLRERSELCAVQCRNYDWIFGQRRIPRATYIFTDRERMDPWQVRVAAGLYAHLRQAGPGYAAVNDPARMMARRSLLRALHAHGINRFDAYAVTERVSPKRFPVFVRREFDHGRPLSDLLYDQAELDAELERLRARREPEDGLLIIEYRAQPVDGDLFRKLSAYRIGGQTFFYNTVHENTWLVKYGTLNAGTDALYRDEQRMIRDNAFKDTVDRAFDIAGVDYGRIDFGLVDGEAQIYEINSNPSIAPPSDHPNPIRQANQRLGWNKYCRAVNALDVSDSRAAFATLFTHPHFKRKGPALRKLGRQRIAR